MLTHSCVLATCLAASGCRRLLFAANTPSLRALAHQAHSVVARARADRQPPAAAAVRPSHHTRAAARARSSSVDSGPAGACCVRPADFTLVVDVTEYFYYYSSATRKFLVRGGSSGAGGSTAMGVGGGASDSRRLRFRASCVRDSRLTLALDAWVQGWAGSTHWQARTHHRLMRAASLIQHEA